VLIKAGMVLLIESELVTNISTYYKVQEEVGKAPMVVNIKGLFKVLILIRDWLPANRS